MGCSTLAFSFLCLFLFHHFASFSSLFFWAALPSSLCLRGWSLRTMQFNPAGMVQGFTEVTDKVSGMSETKAITLMMCLELYWPFWTWLHFGILSSGNSLQGISHSSSATGWLLDAGWLWIFWMPRGQEAKSFFLWLLLGFQHPGRNACIHSA